MDPTEMWVIGGLACGVAYAIIENHKHSKQQVQLNTRLMSIEFTLDKINKTLDTTNNRLDIFLKSEIDQLKMIVRYDNTHNINER